MENVVVCCGRRLSCLDQAALLISKKNDDAWAKPDVNAYEQVNAKPDPDENVIASRALAGEDQ